MLLDFQVLDVFTRCVIWSSDVTDEEKLMLRTLVGYLVIHHDTIMRPPTDLHREVELKLQQMRQVKVSGGGFYISIYQEFFMHMDEIYSNLSLACIFGNRIVGVTGGPFVQLFFSIYIDILAKSATEHR